MPVPLLDLKAQHARIREKVVAAMMQVVDDQSFILGKPVEDFECEIAALSRTRFAIGCANGSDALLLSLRALDVGAGHEVVTSPFTFFATAGAVHNSGAKPVFADIDADTFSLNPEAAAAAVTSRTRAVIPVDLFGQMSPVERYASATKLPIIEDAAQSIGARRSFDGEWRMAGEMAAIGTYSFFPSKNLGGYGDGGMLVTQSEDLAMKLRRLRTHGAIKTYVHEVVGYNSRLDTLQAAVLSAKLPFLAEWSAARRAHAAYYDAAFADLSDIRTPAIDSANESTYNQYTIRTARRDELQAHLKAKEIGTAIYYPIPLHLQQCFAYLGYKQGAFPESERASKEVLSLPVYPELTQAQQDETIAAVRSFFGR
ncbi:MAG: DegT/DnrJ/EryC1/StrS family aminotransferase [Gemmatimonadota bacterium]|nr:DegT/DnrJ/EryC1/StrS family aminotransferase [Gemmatimonadota bacterium]